MVNNKMTRRSFVVMCAAMCAAAALGPALARAVPPPATLKVSAGGNDRRNAVVNFALGNVPTGTTFELTDEAGGPAVNLQVLPDGRAALVVPDLKAGQTRIYRIAAVTRTDDPAPAATADRNGGAIEVRARGKDVLVYRGEKTATPAGYEPQYARGGYIHPLVTPAGVAVTDDYPHNHKHHHGVWAPWTKTEFEGRKPDFWNMGAKTGTVDFVEFGQTWSGPVAAGFTAKHRFVDLSAKPDPRPALNETWRVDAYAVGPAGNAPAYHLFDWQSTQTTASDSPLKLPKYHYGGLGVRGHKQFDGEANSQYLTSEGKTRKDGNDTRAKWVVNYGKVDGKPAYVAALCSPQNFGFPQPVRLHPKEPFMCYAPQMLGDMAIAAGKPYVMKYRFVVGDGEPEKAELDRLWAEYAEPVKVEVK